ncbi:MAG: OmpA family protein [Candidatus Dadabacteria bacterium]|nr:MAG: OmpA family protein [Candidatus Dadabacteria bacterium]
MLKKLIFVIVLVSLPLDVIAQDYLPYDNGLATYHTSPRYRESESHPLRIFAYALHPIGWVAREVIFRPFSYFASSSDVTRSVLGYRDPFDYRQPECFSADDSVPDCRAVMPFNYDAAPEPAAEENTTAAMNTGERQVYFPDVNFDFDVRTLNALGKGRARQIANLLKSEPGLKVVLEGHADYIGSEDYNEKLGMDRAEAVRKELVALGVPAERLATVTFGESQPIFTEKTDWARAVNRRVEVKAEEAQ